MENETWRPVLGWELLGDGWWFKSLAEAKRHNKTFRAICRNIRGGRPTCGGYKWEYA